MARIWDFPRLQIAITGALVLFGSVLWRSATALEQLILGGLAIAVAYQAYRIYPFTPIAPVQVLSSADPDPERKLRLLVANVLARNRNSRPLLDLVAATRPDVLLALEPDHFWQRELSVLADEFPIRLEQPQDNCYGMLLFSRLKLEDAEIRFLMDPDVPSSTPASCCARAIRCTSMSSIRGRRMPSRRASIATPSCSWSAARSTAAPSRRSWRAIPTTSPGPIPRVCSSGSAGLDPRLGRGMFNSFHARNPLMRWPLDHIFFDPEFRLCRIERQGFIGSDHFPILVELSFEPEGADEHEARAPMPGDRAEARRLIREGREN